MRLLLVLASALLALSVRADQYDYKDALSKAILFYEAQRSGKLPSDNRVPWRGDSAMNDKGNNGEDLTGGYYDAGDCVKFGLPMAWTTTTLSWGIIEFADGYNNAGEMEHARAAVKWATDYFIKCHTGPTEFYGQVGDGNADHAQWGRPEDMDPNRPAYKVTADRPGSDLVGETAAALAAASIVFKDSDAGYSATLLQHAKDLYAFADQHRGKYDDVIPAADFYKSWSGYMDELAWGAVWLYKATGDQQYMTFAQTAMQDEIFAGTATEFSWDNKVVGVFLMMYTINQDERSMNGVYAFGDTALKGPFTPKGLYYHSPWGSLRYAANAAFIMKVAAKHQLKTKEYGDFAKAQMDYILGNGGRSYEVGFGNNFPQQPHHRAASCPNRPAPCGWNEYNSGGPNPQVINGALVGGPDQNDNFDDRRSNFQQTEVACDYNAGFSGVLASLN